MPPARRPNKTDSFPTFQAKNKKYVVRIVCRLVCGLFATPDLCRNWSQQTKYHKQSWNIWGGVHVFAVRKGQLPIFVLKEFKNSNCRVVCLVVLKFISYFTRSQSPPRSTLSSIPVQAKYNGGQTFLSKNFFRALESENLWFFLNTL